MNSRFCVTWTRIDHFETCLMVFITKSRFQLGSQDGKLVKVFWWEKIKMATVMLHIWNCFCQFWCGGVQSPRLCKWPWILNWSKRIIDCCCCRIATVLWSYYGYSSHLHTSWCYPVFLRPGLAFPRFPFTSPSTVIRTRLFEGRFKCLYRVLLFP